MEEQQQDLAALHALRLLDNDASSVFEIEAARNGELEKLTTELERTAAELGHAVPAVAPPAHLKDAIMERVRERARAAKPVTTPVLHSRQSPIAWGIAAALAAGGFWLWQERTQLTLQVAALTQVEAEARSQMIAVRDERDIQEKRSALLEQKSKELEIKSTDTLQQLARLMGEVEALKKRDAGAQTQLATLTSELQTLRQRDARAQMQIATLQSTVAAYKQGVAVVVWDSEKHQGVLKLERMPPVEAGKDYQLWVVDPKNPSPVNAGVVRVDAQGFAKVDFKPVEFVSEAAKFALSVEKEGGVPKNEGPIILIGP